MRFLFSFTGGTGHFVPTTVFARALVRRGHEVLYSCQEGMVASVV
jgi:UDP:flavonoid glycosyltransferase YjiC (YdhE family)